MTGSTSPHRRAPLRTGLVRAGLRFLARRPHALATLAGWSVLEAAHSFALGFGVAHALDDGFLAGDVAAGLGWLALTAVAVVLGAVGTGRVYGAVAALAEPLRDLLVHRVVGQALGADAGAGVEAGSGDAGRGGSAVVSRLTHQVEIARDSFAGLVMVSRSFVFSAAGALFGLLSLAPLLLFVVLPPLVCGLALFFMSLRPMARRQQAFLVADEDIAQALGTTFSGLRDVVACGAEERMRIAGVRCIDAERRAADRLARWGVTRALALGVGGRLPVVLLLVLAPWLLSRGVTAGALAGALTYLTHVLLPALQSLVHGLGGAGARLAVVIGRLRRPPTAAAQPQPLPQAQSQPEPFAPSVPLRRSDGFRVPGSRSAAPPPAALEMRGVSFGYGAGAAPVIDDLSLLVPAGGHLAVVGPSGIGKSTLTSLVAGLLRPGSGEIRLGGRPVALTGPGALGGERVLIPQEAYVFSGSVRANLGYLCPVEPTDEALSAATAAVGAEALVRRLGGPDGAVDPAALSAGERQLLALVRAHLSPAPLAVLDEATCHLDPAAEARAERAFAERRCRGSGPEGARTYPAALIVIAHRISSARRAGRVLVLDGARADCGTHAELLERSALYRDLSAGWDPSVSPSQPARSL
ncbi:MAG: ATP-binding cassette domain-containing protein [Streptomyces sp.]|uniref:ATP-binding cassette domain-containing protein n=1 Tax=Streptomyces sp. TaxID=1931 RepID=UPI003D6BF13A